jgi:uncharacterized protein
VRGSWLASRNAIPALVSIERGEGEGVGREAGGHDERIGDRPARSRGCAARRFADAGRIDVSHPRPVNEQAEPHLAWPAILGLHLGPGALATALFVAIADPVQRAGYPPLLAFLIAVALVIVPVELGLILRAGRHEGPARSLPAVRYRRPMARRDWLRVTPAVLIASVISFGVLSVTEPGIRDTLGWLPNWFRELVDTDAIDRFSADAWRLTLAVYVILNVVLGPVVEELYFRGYLLPRMSHLGRWAPLVNTVLFSLYHFWTPWAFLARIAGVAPFVYAVWWKQNVYLGMAVHIALNAIGTASLVALVLGQLP